MKRIFIVLLSLLLCAPGLVACSQSYPDSALYVGKNEEYESIQSAVDAASISGQFIVVKSGTYEEDIFISKPVKIVGKSHNVVLNGSVTISCDGVYFEKIFFNGKNEKGNGIIIDNSKDVTGLNLVQCSFKNYTQHAIFSHATLSDPKKFNALTLQYVTFISNEVSAININNIKTMNIQDCYFEKNGEKAEEGALAGAIIVDLSEGEYSSIEIHSTEFKMNSNKSNSRNAAFVCSHKNSYNGEIVFDNCLFQGNSYDIVSGIEGQPNSSMNICVINARGLKTDVKKLDKEND